MLRGLAKLFSRPGDPPSAAPRARIALATRPALAYAIGDVHGCLDELEALERLIVEDAGDIAGDKWIVLLGDYIDRGPRSRAVIDHLLDEPPPGFRRLALLGNHEQMLLDFLDSPARNGDWLDLGALATLASYGADVAGLGRLPPVAAARALMASMPRAHASWLRDLPILLEMPGFVFVHAGLRPRVSVADQRDEDLLWIREPDGLPPDGVVVVHGHTPATEPTVIDGRICIDTAAFATGRLTAVRIDAAGSIRFLSTADPVAAGGLP